MADLSDCVEGGAKAFSIISGVVGVCHGIYIASGMWDQAHFEGGEALLGGVVVLMGSLVAVTVVCLAYSAAGGIVGAVLGFIWGLLTKLGGTD